MTDTNILTLVAICISAQLENVVCCANTASLLVKMLLSVGGGSRKIFFTQIPARTSNPFWAYFCRFMVVMDCHGSSLACEIGTHRNGCDRYFSLQGFALFSFGRRLRLSFVTEKLSCGSGLGR